MFALASRDCGIGGSWPSSPATTTPPPTPALSYCNADPPVGCAAYCKAVDDVELTSACADIGASAREAAFQMHVQQFVDQAHAQAEVSCDQAAVGTLAVTPCQDGLPPQEWPGQDHEYCTPPPPTCIVVIP
jgi:hypothetical protein